MKLKVEMMNPSVKVEFEDYDVDDIGRILSALSEWERSRAGTLGLRLSTSSGSSIDPLMDQGNPAPASSVNTGDIHGSGGSFVSSFSPVDGYVEDKK